MLGKAYRLGLTRRDPSAYSAKRSYNGAGRRASAAAAFLGNGHVDGKCELAALACDPPIEDRISLIDLKEEHCRWPLEGGSCGRKNIDGSPYCDGHHEAAYRARPITYKVIG